MSNLTPEKRQDKNGRMVIRHVKTVTAVPGAGRIPQPQIDQRNPAEDKRLVDFASPKDGKDFLEKVQDASPELVALLNGFYERHNKSHLTREVADHTIQIIGSARSTKSIKRYAENLTTHFEFMRSLKCGDYYGIMLINGLIDVEDRVTGPLSERQQQAVMRITSAMTDNEFVDRLNDVEMRVRHNMYHYVITDEELLHMVADSPENDSFIAAALSAGTLQPGQIKAALDDDIQQPLLGGAL